MSKRRSKELEPLESICYWCSDKGPKESNNEYCECGHKFKYHGLEHPHLCNVDWFDTQYGCDCPCFQIPFDIQQVIPADDPF